MKLCLNVSSLKVCLKHIIIAAEFYMSDEGVEPIDAGNKGFLDRKKWVR